MRRVVAAVAALLCCPVVAVTTQGERPASANAGPDTSVHAAADRDGDSARRGDRSGRPRDRGRPSRSERRGIGRNDLTVNIKRMNTYLEKREPITMRVTVRNTTEQEWSDLQGYVILSDAPLADRDAVAEFADSPTDEVSGNRITSDFASIGRLEVGERKRFTIRIPYKQVVKRLGGAPTNGVYKSGIHVLAYDEEGTRRTAGRARTMLPYLDDRKASGDPVEVSMVWPFTTTIRRSPDGTYPDAESLLEDIAQNGRLGRMLEAAENAPARSITLLLDPALLEALSAIANDTYGPPESGAPPGPLLADDTPGGDDTAPALANAYLSRLRSVANAQDVWTTPYALPDLDALASHERRRAARAVYGASARAARHILGRFGVSGRLAYLPTDGIAGLDSLRWAEARATGRSKPAAILSPAMLDGWDPADPSVVSLDADGSTIPTVVDDDSVMTGGPLPGRSDSALQVRQRLASEAAVRAMERAAGASTSKQLSVVVDPRWNPGPAARRTDLFDVMDATWVTPVSPARQRAADWRGQDPEPDPEADEPLPGARVDAASKIVRDAEDLAAMVDGDNDGDATRSYYAGSASMVVSQNWRGVDALEAEDYADAMADQAGSQLDRVTIEGPGFVSFSGNSGPLPITIHNGLDVPIEVGVTIRARGQKLSVPNMPAETIQPGQSPSFTVDADIGEVSNTAFEATLTTPDGDTFGRPAEFNVRSSVVGMAIWIGMGVAGLLVVLALARQIRRRRSASLAGETEP